MPPTAAANDASAGRAPAAPTGAPDFAAVDSVFPEQARPAGRALADLVFRLLLDQAERAGGAAAVVPRGPGLDRVRLAGRFDLEEPAADLGTFFG